MNGTGDTDTTILAIDTAGRAAQAGVFRGGRALAAECLPMVRGQAEHLLPLVERVMAAAGTEFSALGLVAVTVGPGSFTGLRVGLAAARGFEIALGCPLAGVSSLSAWAMGTRPGLAADDRILVLLDSRRGGDAFAQVFDGTAAPLSDAAAASPAAALAEALAALPPRARLGVAGDLAGLEMPGDPRLCDRRGEAPDLAAVAAAAPDARHRRAAEPLYLRAADAVPARRG